FACRHPRLAADAAALQFRHLACAARRTLYFVRFLKRRAISSVVERLLHTQEVAGSNPASRIFLPFAGNPKRHIRIERSPRRQVAGSNPASRIFLPIAVYSTRHIRIDGSPHYKAARPFPASRVSLPIAVTECPHLSIE